MCPVRLIDVRYQHISPLELTLCVEGIKTGHRLLGCLRHYLLWFCLYHIDVVREQLECLRF